MARAGLLSATRVSRRAMIVGGALFMLTTGSGPSAASQIVYPRQPGWALCGKCRSLFYNGHAGKGRCAAGGEHQSDWVDFALYMGIREGAGVQVNWRGCAKCMTLFYDGFAAKGVCPAGGAHAAAGANYSIFHDTRGAANYWSFCAKCYAMIYTINRHPNAPSNDRCPAGGAHDPRGFRFNL